MAIEEHDSPHPEMAPIERRSPQPRGFQTENPWETIDFRKWTGYFTVFESGIEIQKKAAVLC